MHAHTLSSCPLRVSMRAAASVTSRCRASSLAAHAASKSIIAAPSCCTALRRAVSVARRRHRWKPASCCACSAAAAATSANTAMQWRFTAVSPQWISCVIHDTFIASKQIDHTTMLCSVAACLTVSGVAMGFPSESEATGKLIAAPDRSMASCWQRCSSCS